MHTCIATQLFVIKWPFVALWISILLMYYVEKLPHKSIILPESWIDLERNVLQSYEIHS